MTKLLSFFSSIKLAVVLILVISAFSLMGIFLPQIPYDYTLSPEGSAWWLNNIAYAQVGAPAGFLYSLGFFDIFHSAWFFVPCLLLFLSILVCSLSRFGKIRPAWRRAALRRDGEFYKKGKYNAELEINASVEEVYGRAQKTLKKMRYSLAGEEKEAEAFAAGNKNRFSAFGTYFVHFSLFIFLIGIVLGLSAGFKNDSFIVFEGSAREVGYGTGLALYLKSFADEYWEDGTPKDYRSEAEIYKDGMLVKSGVIRVNHPMEWDGVRFYQSFFGPAVRMEITDADGETVYDGDIALSGVSPDGDLQRPQGSVQLESGEIAVVVGQAVNGEDPVLGSGEMGLELYDADLNFLGWATLEKSAAQEVGGFGFTYTDDLKFSGFLVARDPGTGFIWTASVLFLLGLALIFYLPDRRVWISLAGVGENGTKVLLRLRSTKGFGLDAEMEKIIAELKGKQPDET